MVRLCVTECLFVSIPFECESLRKSANLRLRSLCSRDGAEWRYLHLLRAGVHFIFHSFVLFGLIFTMCAYNNNDFAMEKEDRLLLEEDTPVFSEATVQNETELELRDSEGHDDAVRDNELKMEVEGIFATSPSASPVTRVESSVIMSPTVLLTPSSSEPSSVSTVTDSLDGVQSTALSRSSSAPSSVSTVTDSLDGVQSTALSRSSSARRARARRRWRLTSRGWWRTTTACSPST